MVSEKQKRFDMAKYRVVTSQVASVERRIDSIAVRAPKEDAI